MLGIIAVNSICMKKATEEAKIYISPFFATQRRCLLRACPTQLSGDGVEIFVYICVCVCGPLLTRLKCPSYIVLAALLQKKTTEATRWVGQVGFWDGNLCPIVRTLYWEPDNARAC